MQSLEKRSASQTPRINKLWIHDLRTNKQFAPKTSQLRRGDLNEFVCLYCAVNRHQRKAAWSTDNPDGRWRMYCLEELIARWRL